jgi:hypothetical protein
VRSFLGLTCALGIAVAGGYALTDVALGRADQFSRQDVGAWNFWPQAGSMQADPYLRAITARRAILPMGLGEGIGLVAQHDSTGAPLVSRCDYLLTGRMPSARALTISAYGLDGRPFQTGSGRTALNGDELLRQEDGAFSVAVSAEPAAGNWLPLAANMPFVLVLRLYDTPLGANAAALTEPSVPAVTQVRCR